MKPNPLEFLWLEMTSDPGMGVSIKGLWPRLAWGLGQVSVSSSGDGVKTWSAQGWQAAMVDIKACLVMCQVRGALLGTRRGSRCFAMLTP